MASAPPTGGGGGGTPPPGSPAPGSPIPGSPIPLASGDYATAAATANAAYQNALAQINGQRQQALQSFGYKGTIDPATGTLTDMQVDTNNPYGQFQQMLGTHAADQQQIAAADQQRGLGAMYGARGGGLAAQGLTNDKLAFGADSANLGQSLMSTLGDLQGQQGQAQDTMNNALWQAELGSAQNAIQGQSFDPANFSGVTDQPVDGGAMPGAKTYTTSKDGGSAPKTTKVTPRQSTHAGRGVRYRPAKGNTFHKAVQSRSTKGRRRR